MRRKWWFKLSIVLLAFVAILYVAFWIALFNPLEGSIERLDAMVPSTVSWYVQGPWGRIRKSEVLEKHLFRTPLMDEVTASFQLEKTLFGPVRQLEKQVNAEVPSFLGKFSVLDDLAGREVALAGNFSNRGPDLEQKILNSPYLLLTRISFKAKFMDVLKYEAVRKHIPGLKAYRDFYQYDVGEQAIREGAPEDARYIYFQRTKDVLIVSNDRDLMEQAVHFGRAGGISQESLRQEFFYFYDTQGKSPKDNMLAWMKVSQGDNELGNALEGRGQEREGNVSDFLRAFFPVGQTISVTLKPGFGDVDRIPLRGDIRLYSRIPKHLIGLHTSTGREIAPTVGEWASYLAADRTFALLFLKMAPREFLYTILSSLDSATRQILFGDEEQKAGDQKWDADSFSKAFGDWFEDGVTMSWARLPEVKDIDLDTWDGGAPKPLPAVTMMLKVKQSLDPEHLVEFFRDNKDQFGLEAPQERKVPMGRMFVLKTPTDLARKLRKPAFALVGHEFLFSSNADELERMLAVKGGDGDPVSESRNYKDAVASTFKEANLFVFIDMERARPFILDQRWQAAFDSTYFNEKDFRRDAIVKLTTEYPKWTMQQRQQRTDQLLQEKWRQVKQVDFPDAIQRYRNNMIWYEPFKWICLADAPVADPGGEIRLDLDGEIRLRSSGK